MIHLTDYNTGEQLTIDPKTITFVKESNVPGSDPSTQVGNAFYAHTVREPKEEVERLMNNTPLPQNRERRKPTEPTPTEEQG